MSDDTDKLTDETRPALWHPNAAANWSLVFTPVFGAYIHALNWKALSIPERAKANMIWAWTCTAFLIFNLVVILTIDDQSQIDATIHIVGVALLFGWYFTQGRSQIKYVRESLSDDYVRKSLSKPLLIGVVGVAAYFITAMVLAIATYSPAGDKFAQ